MKHTDYAVLFGVLVILGLLFIGLGVAINEAIGDKTIKEVPCYDKFSNKIKGEICESEYYSSVGGNLLMIIGITFLFISYLCLMIGIMREL